METSSSSKGATVSPKTQQFQHYTEILFIGGFSYIEMIKILLEYYLNCKIFCPNNDKNYTVISLKDYPAGIYYVTLEMNNAKTETIKLIVTK